MRAALPAGPGRPRDLRGVAQNAGRILRNNVYGWFERTQRGTYRLTRLGEAALQRWASITLDEAAEAAGEPRDGRVGRARLSGVSGWRLRFRLLHSI